MQPLQRTRHYRFGIALALSEQRSDFRMRIAFELMQYDDRTCARRQALQQRPGIDRLGGRRRVVRGVVESAFRILLGETLACAQLIDRGIDRRTLEPGAERRLATIAAYGRH